MSKFQFFTFLFIISFSGLNAQILVDFESVPLIQGINNGSNHSGGFEQNGFFFRNYYDDQFASWGGFGASNKVDTSNGTFSNQYSCFAGMGGLASEKFAIAYYYEPVVLKNMTGQTLKLQSFQYTNSTWAGKTMRNGDAFSKKFGGLTGNDPDYFKIQVFNHLNGQITDSADVYLADFRFADNSQDYIVKSWRQATFNFNNPFDSISFRLESTDVGGFGMNTPAYFCLDNIQFSILASNSEIKNQETRIFPNPFENEVFIGGSNTETLKISDFSGKEVVPTTIPEKGGYKVETNQLPKGLYFFQIANRKPELMMKN